MNDKSNRYALAALKDKRASLAGEIAEMETKLRYWRDQLTHLDATIAVFEPDYQPSKRIKRPRRVKLFRQGELNRLILDALRNAKGKPLSTKEVASAVMAAQGHDESARPALAPRVRTNLQYMARQNGSVAKLGDRRSAKWKLAGDQMALLLIKEALVN